MAVPGWGACGSQSQTPFPMHEPPFLSEPDHATDEHLFQKKNIYKKDLDFFVGFWSK